MTIEAAMTVDVLSNLDGGLSRGTEVLENYDLTIELDLERALGWRGASFFLYGLGNHGGKLTEERIGDFQTASNIEAPDAARVYEAWLDQRLLDDRLSFRLGLYDLNSEFDANETGSLFINSSHGIGPDFSQSGANGPSIFPVTSLGLRTLVRPTPGSYIQAVVLDGVPGDPERERGTHIRFDHGDGALIAAEGGLYFGGPDDWQAKISLGWWTYTEELTVDAAGEGIAEESNTGAYLLAEMRLVEEPADPRQGLATFVRLGTANDDVNPVDQYLGAGLVYTGAIPGRDADQIGLAVAHARTSDVSRRALGFDSHETSVELSYLAEISPWLAIQPDLQYIVNPGMDPELDDALVAGLRLVVSASSN